MKKLALLLGMGLLLASAQSAAHVHHHGKPLT
ncbi:metal-binding protein ZinT, partial [Leptospira borgpetersenii serovar Ballum]|nr:metal-binding protein ZinT [Leptospira borgpetersenii serovar Ballum]